MLVKPMPVWTADPPNDLPVWIRRTTWCVVPEEAKKAAHPGGCGNWEAPKRYNHGLWASNDEGRAVVMLSYCVPIL